MNWPLVDVKDDGIRPAGKPDECFYCHSKVGQQHGLDCVIVTKIVEYNVLFLGTVVGIFQRDEPYYWDNDHCEFHKNESSWCKSNALDDIVWRDTEIALKLKKELNENEANDVSCACGVIDFEVNEIVDPGPNRKIAK